MIWETRSIVDFDRLVICWMRSKEIMIDRLFGIDRDLGDAITSGRLRQQLVIF